jgi:hypothetical protein
MMFAASVVALLGTSAVPEPPLMQAKIHQICFVTPFFAAGDKREARSGRPIVFPCRPADFGAPNSFAVKGQHNLKVAEPNDACSEEVTCDGRSCGRQIVLVFRGGCTFYQKAKNLMKQKPPPRGNS